MISNSRNRAAVLTQRILGRMQPVGGNRLDAGAEIGSGAVDSTSLTFVDEEGNNRKWWRPLRHGWFDENAIVI